MSEAKPIDTKEYILNGCEYLECEKNKLISEWGYHHPESKFGEETYRTNFRRQRDRIMYTGGFRRLQDKTQVISAMKSGDHRTRLTHTLEVEQIAISLSDALGLNSDLVSAIAIGHDVGHTPFGHAVERVLNKNLIHEGGFSHAVQSVKYLKETVCAKGMPDEVIKLQNVIFEGILKHDTDVYAGSYDNKQFDCSAYDLESAGILEMQVVYWSDKIAYLSHDFEDFYKTEIYTNAKKGTSKLDATLKKHLANLIPQKRTAILKDLKKFETRDLIRNVIANLLENSIININSQEALDSKTMKEITTSRIKAKEKELADKDRIEHGHLEVEYIKNLEKKLMETRLKSEQDSKNIVTVKNIEVELKAIKDIKKEAYMHGLIINFEGKYRGAYSELRKFLNQFYILSPEITRSDAKAIKIAEALFKDFTNNDKLLPLNIQKRIKEKSCSKNRVIADYIASMTDRYAEVIYTDLNAIGGNYDY